MEDLAVGGGEVLKGVEVNTNGFALDGVEKIDFDIEKGCFMLVFEDGRVQEFYL